MTFEALQSFNETLRLEMPKITGTSKCLGTLDFFGLDGRCDIYVFCLGILIGTRFNVLTGTLFLCVCVLSFFVSTICVFF